MRLNAKLGIATAVSALAVAAPAVAQACTNPGQGQAQGQTQTQGQAQHANRFRAQNTGFSRGFRGRHGRRFRRDVTGTLVSWTATQTGTNTYSGSITISKSAFRGHWANQQGTTQTTQVTYTFTNAKVLFGQGANPPAAGDLVTVAAAFPGHCNGNGTSSSSTSSSTPSVRAIFIRQAPSSSSTQSS
jgi:hypothetical protein